MIYFKEFIWIGRGGQGAFTAARLLGAAFASKPGMYSLAFPTFGPERRGAPVSAYTKVDKKKIGNRAPSQKADVLIVLDQSLLEHRLLDSLKPGGRLLLNSCDDLSDERILCLDAKELSLEVLGRNIPNTVFLGAIAALDNELELSDIELAIKDLMPKKLQAKNIELIKKVYGEVRGRR